MTIKKKTVPFSPMLPTPNWAKWMFRITFALTTAAAFIIASDPHIPDDWKIRLGVWLKGLDMFVYGISKTFGLKDKP